MKAKKNKKSNAYLLFVQDWRQRQATNVPWQESIQKAGADWEQLSAAERLPYQNAAKQSLALDPESRTQPEAAASALSEEQKLEEQNRCMQRHVERIVGNSVRRGELESRSYFFIAINYFTKVAKSEMYTPAELAANRFSLREGIQHVYHTLINPGCSVYGAMYDTQEHAKTTHQLLIPPNALGDTNLEQILQSLVSFLQSHRHADEEDNEIPPVFTLKEHIPMVSSALKYLNGSIELKVYAIEYLYYILKEACCQVSGLPPPKSIYETNAKFELDPYAFETNISCDYHECLDLSKYCAKSCVTRWGFMFAGYMCNDLAIKMRPNCHFPHDSENCKMEDNDMNSEIAEETEEEQTEVKTESQKELTNEELFSEDFWDDIKNLTEIMEEAHNEEDNIHVSELAYDKEDGELSIEATPPPPPPISLEEVTDELAMFTRRVKKEDATLEVSEEKREHRSRTSSTENKIHSRARLRSKSRIPKHGLMERRSRSREIKCRTTSSERKIQSKARLRSKSRIPKHVLTERRSRSREITSKGRTICSKRSASSRERQCRRLERRRSRSTSQKRSRICRSPYRPSYQHRCRSKSPFIPRSRSTSSSDSTSKLDLKGNPFKDSKSHQRSPCRRRTTRSRNRSPIRHRNRVSPALSKTESSSECRNTSKKSSSRCRSPKRQRNRASPSLSKNESPGKRRTTRRQSVSPYRRRTIRQHSKSRDRSPIWSPKRHRHRLSPPFNKRESPGKSRTTRKHSKTRDHSSIGSPKSSRNRVSPALSTTESPGKSRTTHKNSSSRERPSLSKKESPGKRRTTRRLSVSPYRRQTKSRDRSPNRHRNRMGPSFNKRKSPGKTRTSTKRSKSRDRSSIVSPKRSRNRLSPSFNSRESPGKSRKTRKLSKTRDRSSPSLSTKESSSTYRTIRDRQSPRGLSSKNRSRISSKRRSKSPKESKEQTVSTSSSTDRPPIMSSENQLLSDEPLGSPIIYESIHRDPSLEFDTKNDSPSLSKSVSPIMLQQNRLKEPLLPLPRVLENSIPNPNAPISPYHNLISLPVPPRINPNLPKPILPHITGGNPAFPLPGDYPHPHQIMHCTHTTSTYSSRYLQHIQTAYTMNMNAMSYGSPVPIPNDLGPHDLRHRLGPPTRLSEHDLRHRIHSRPVPSEPYPYSAWQSDPYTEWSGGYVNQYLADAYY